MAANMMKPPSKKRKIEDNVPLPNVQSSVTDPRFANIQSDPRYRLPTKRRAYVKVDKRFSHMLLDDDFARKAKVDRYGRPLEDDSERKRLKRRYEFEDEIDDDEEVQKELLRVQKSHDPIRDGEYSQSSSSEDSSSEEDEPEEDAEDQVATLQDQQDEGILMGDASSRIAAVNLDWDNIRATDLMAVFSSFLPPGGRLLRVSVYPSQFGKERMEREEMEGPPREIFASLQETQISQDAKDDIDEDEQIKNSIVQPGATEDFDSAALRRYQLQRLQYFYAVLTFSSANVARVVYDAVDGTEYLTTANFFDLRFIPNETDFSEDEARDDCEKIPDGYKPNEFVTEALQHSNVKLTWDAEDASRKDAQAKAFRGSRKDIDENDLKAYLGSDSSSDEEFPVDTETALGSSLSKKEQERQKMRALLGLSTEPKPTSKPSDGPVGDMQITFSSGLSVGNSSKRSVFENEPEIVETTVEKYVRRERERKQRRKDKMKNARQGVANAAADESTALMKASDEQPEDLGFDDPFFAAPEHDKASAAKLRKEERKKRRAERDAEEAMAAVKRAELELLMVDDKNDGKGMQHFNMNEIEKEEKRAKKKGKKGKSKNEAEAGVESGNSGFKMDTQDPRFARLYENHEFAIDPTNPRFKGTEGMKALLEEGRRHRKEDRGLKDEEPAKEIPRPASDSPHSTNNVRKSVERMKGKRRT